MKSASTWPATALATIRAVSMAAALTAVSGIGARIVFMVMTIPSSRGHPRGGRRGFLLDIVETSRGPRKFPCAFGLHGEMAPDHGLQPCAVVRSTGRHTARRR